MGSLNVKAVAALAAVAIFTVALFTCYHLKTVSGLEKELAQARREALAAKDAHNSFIADLLRQTAQAFRSNAESVARALKAREETRYEIRQEGKTVTADIVVQQKAPGEADPDLPLPDSFAAGLKRLHGKAAAAGRNPGGGAAVAARRAVSGTPLAGTSGGQADSAQAGGMDGGYSGLVR